MSEFDSLKEVYEHLEKNALDYEYIDQISSLFQKIRDVKSEEQKLEESQWVQWEIDCLNFVISDGQIHPKTKSIDNKTKITSYPNFELFTDDAYNYLDERLNKTQNPLLKSRYSHFLWESPKKHHKYAKMAIDAYFDLIRKYEEKDKEDTIGRFGMKILGIFKNLHQLSLQTKLRLNDTKNRLLHLLHNFNPNSTSKFGLKCNLLEIMLKSKKLFRSNDFEGIENVCYASSKELIQKDNINFSNTFLEFGESVDKKLNKSSHFWRKLIAENYEKLMIQRSGDNAAIYFCIQAIQNYKKANNEEKVKKLESIYTDLTSSAKMSKFEDKVDLSEHMKECKSAANKLVKKSSPKQIILTFIFNKNILPTLSEVETDQDKYATIFQLAPIVINDQNGHTAQHFTTDEEKTYYSILQNYSWSLQLNKIHFINRLFFTAIQENKLSEKVIVDFLIQNSWLGKTIVNKIYGEEVACNWLNQIFPAIQEYFSQAKIFLSNYDAPISLVMCIDSITLKIEGIIRNICQFEGITTFHTMSDSEGREITRERDINFLLRSKALKELFDKDDLLFFKFLLVEKAGYNLRHKVAHSLMRIEEYEFSQMHLLILALLKLAQHNLVEKVGVKKMRLYNNLSSAHSTPSSKSNPTNANE